MLLHWNGHTYRWRVFRKVLDLNYVRRCMTLWIMYVSRRKQTEQAMALADIQDRIRLQSKCGLTQWQQGVMLQRAVQCVRDRYHQRLTQSVWKRWKDAFYRMHASIRAYQQATTFRRTTVQKRVWTYWVRRFHLVKASTWYVRSWSLFPQLSTYDSGRCW